MLEGKNVFISGGSRGLGSALCRTFAAYGARIAFNYSSDESSANKIRDELTAMKCKTLIFKNSVTDLESIELMTADIEKQWGEIDILVNNTGVSQTLPFPLLEIEDWEHVMDVNVKGVYILTRSFLRGMIRLKSGVILNIGSTAGERVIESPIHYGASKAAVSGFTRSLALEVGRYNIRVNCIAPGLMDEGIGKNLPQYKRDDYIEHSVLKRLVKSEEVAELAAFMVSPGNSFMTGTTIVMDGGI